MSLEGGKWWSEVMEVDLRCEECSKLCLLVQFIFITEALCLWKSIGVRWLFQSRFGTVITEHVNGNSFRVMYASKMSLVVKVLKECGVTEHTLEWSLSEMDHPRVLL